MHIKRFDAGSIKEAMKAVKAEFGDSALILSTKKKGPGLFEVVAAIDYDMPGAQAVDVQSPRASDKAIEKELRELRDLKELVLRAYEKADSMHSAIFLKLKTELVNAGIDERLARRVLATAMKGVADERMRDIDYIKSLVKGAVYEKVSTLDPLAGRSILAFVGPPGAGKTTTIAKLAAIQAIKKRRKTALLTMDTYRIAATEQIRLYGRIIGVDVGVAGTPKDFASFLSAHQDKDAILIDTAGGARSDAGRMRELKDLAGICPKVRFNLVLDTTAKDEFLYRSLDAYSGLPVDSLTFTHIDEGVRLGSVLNTAILARRPVAYLTTGQKVPEDIEFATKDRLLNFLLPN